jgi:hypothetical protein
MKLNLPPKLVEKLFWVPAISFCKIFIPSWVFDALLCRNWPFSPLDRLTLRITLLYVYFQIFYYASFHDFNILKNLKYTYFIVIISLNLSPITIHDNQRQETWIQWTTWEFLGLYIFTCLWNQICEYVLINP